MSYTSTPGDGRSALLKILNIQLNKNYTLDDVDFSLPAINSDPTHNRNSKVTVTFKSTRGNYGKLVLYYNRIHIGSLPPLTVSRGAATTYHDLIPVLNSTFNLRITTADIDNSSLPDQVSGTITITLPVSDVSYLYYDTAAINTVGFVPTYDIFKPAHTLLSYFCSGFDRYGIYSDNAGGEYDKLIEIDSPDCGFENGLPRLILNTPILMSALEETDSNNFTLTLQNGVVEVTGSIISAGLTITPSTFTLSPASPSITFTVKSNTPGTYQINVTNNQTVSNPVAVYFSVIDKYNTTYSVTAPVVNGSFINQNSNAFSVTGYNVDPDEPVTVNINTSNGLIPSVASVVLTSATPVASFTVMSETVGSYFINFTNNRNLPNSTQLPYGVLPAMSLTLTPPSEPVILDTESGLFTVTLVNGIGNTTVTPVAVGATSIVPSSFIVSPSQPTGSFKVTYGNTGANQITLINNSNAINPNAYNFNVIPKPYFTINSPSSTIYNGQNSDVFTVTLLNGYKPVTVSLSSNVDTLSAATLNLTPINNIATFTVTEATVGSYFVDFTNNQNYQIPSRINFDVIRTPNAAITLTGPNVTNLEIGETSSTFSVSLIDHAGPVTLTLVGTSGITFSTPTIVLDSNTPTATFTVTSSSIGTKSISITNNVGIINPSAISLFIRNADFVELTTIPNTIRANTLSDNFVITLLNPYVSVDVTPVCSNGVFTPTTLTLSNGTPSRTFRGTFSNQGTANVTLSTSPNTPTSQNINLTVLEQILPELQLTAPSGTIYNGDLSNNFTVTLINGQSSVSVTVITDADTGNGTVINLTPFNPTGTFKISDSEAGTYSVSITNNSGIVNPPSLNIEILQKVLPTLELQTPLITTLDTGQQTSNFTVTLVNGIESVIITPVSSIPVIFTPTSLTLSLGSPVGTFKVTSNLANEYSISVTNNKNIINTDVVLLTYQLPELLTFTKPAGDIYVGIESGNFTLSLVNGREPVTVTPTPINNVTFTPSSVILTPAIPSATFKGLFELANLIFLTTTNSRNLPNPNVLNFNVSNVSETELIFGAPEGPYSIGSTISGFYIQLLNAIDDIDVTITSTISSINGLSFTLTSASPIYNFSITQPTAGAFTIDVSNTSGVSNPSTTTLEFFSNSSSLTMTGPSDTISYVGQNAGPFTVTLVNPTAPVVVTLDELPGLTITPSTYTLQPGDATFNFNIFTPSSADVFNLKLTNDSGLINPANIRHDYYSNAQIFIIGPTENINVGQTKQYTFSLFNIAKAVTLTIPSIPGLTLSQYTFALNTDVSEINFNITFDQAGTYVIPVNSSSGILYPEPLSLTTVGAVIPSISLNRSGSGTIFRDQEETFTVTLTNYLNDVEITPNSDLSVIFGGYTPPMILNGSNPTDTFTVKCEVVENYSIGITNNLNIPNPESINLTVVNGYITLQKPASSYGIDTESGDFIVTLVGYQQPTIIDINISNFTSGILTIDPAAEYSSNQILLDSQTTTATFRIQNHIPGQSVISLTNDSGLTDPSNETISFFDDANISIIAPTQSTVFLNKTITDLKIEAAGVIDPILVTPYVDNLVDDPYKNNVSLLLDFSGNVNSTEIIDQSSKKKPVVADNGFKLIEYNLNEMVGSFTSTYSSLSIRKIDVNSNMEDFIFGSGNFTIEFDLILTAIDINFILTEYRIPDPTKGWMIYINSNGTISWISLGATLAQTTSSINNGVKNNIAISRLNNQLYLFVNGILETQVPINDDYSDSPDYFSIGRDLNYASSGLLPKGKIASLKVTKGIGRYSSNYTVNTIKKLKFIPASSLISTDGQFQPFEIKAPYTENYKIGLRNNKDIVEPNLINLTFEKTPTIIFTPPSNKVNNLGDVSSVYTVSLMNPSIPVNLIITLQSGLVFGTQPTNLTDVNTITLDVTNPLSTFTLTSSTIGTYSISINNEGGLNNPNSLSHSFVDPSGEPITIDQNNLNLNLNKPDDTTTVLNIFQTLI